VLPSEAPSLAPTVAPPTAAPPTRTPRPTKTPAPPTVGPTGPGPLLTNLRIVEPAKDPATGTYIFYATGCTGEVTHATISVDATDSDGIGVIYLWFKHSTGSWQNVEMETTTGTTRAATIASDGSWGDGQVDFYVEAYDSVEDSSTDYPGKSLTLVMKYCAD
jgi:hypothetical protein